MALEIESKLPQLLSKPELLPLAISNWKLISGRMYELGINDDYNHAAMCATVAVETGHTFQPITEYGSQNYFVKNYWDNVNVRRMIGNKYSSDAYLFCGHGFIQLTGRGNYLRASEELQIPELFRNPTIANHPEVAAKVAVWYWETHGLVKMCEGLQKEPSHALWIEVRRRVNGGINGLDEFLKALKILGMDTTA